MTNHQYGTTSTEPERRLLEDGRIGYFYSLQQLEYMRDQKIKQVPFDVAVKHFNRTAGNALALGDVLRRNEI